MILMNSITYRQEIEPSDLGAILNIVQSSGFFSAAEVELACELAADRLEHGQQSSYQFLFAEDEWTGCRLYLLWLDSGNRRQL